MGRYALIGPTYPYRGGIAHYTTLMAMALRRIHQVLLISFSKQYPRWLFPGRSDRDPSEQRLHVPAEYLLDPLNPVTWTRTLRRLRQWRPDVVVIPWWVPFWAAAWAAIGRGTRMLPSQPRLLFICHNVLPHEQGILRPFLPCVVRMALGSGHGHLVHSRPDGEALRRILPRARFRVSPHPTYAALGESPARSLPVDVPGDRPLLLFAGFVRPYKGLDVLLEAMTKVRRPMHLLVAGEFWQGTRPYREHIERLGLRDSVTLLDRYLPNEQLAAAVRRADVIVLPYLTATQSGIVQLAFGQHKPVITTRVGGLPEVVTHEQTGLLVPPGDAAALAAAIERYFAEDLAPRFASNIARENERFSWQRLTSCLDELARECGTSLAE